MIEIKDEWYYVGIWYAELSPMVATKQGGNWMGIVYQKDDDPKDRWHVMYRFRYFEDDKIHDSKDRLSWYGFTAEGQTLEHVKDVTDKLLKEGTEVGGFVHAQFLPIYGMGRKAAEVLQAQPMFSGRPATDEDVKRFQAAVKRDG